MTVENANGHGDYWVVNALGREWGPWISRNIAEALAGDGDRIVRGSAAERAAAERQRASRGERTGR